MTSSGLTIRETGEDDVPELGRLFEAVFGTPRDAEVWIWKYFRNPFGRNSWVAEADGRLVFHCGGTPVPFLDHGREIMALQLTDFMKDSRHADAIGPGSAFARTTAAFFASVIRESRVSMMYGFPGERHRMAGEKLLDYRSASPVFEARLSPVGTGVSSRPLSESDLSRFEGHRPDLGMDRRSPMLRWRYLERPDARYGLVEDEEGGSFAIVRESDDEVRLMELGGRVRVEGIRSLAARLESMGRPVIGWFPPDQVVGEALGSAGFTFSRRDHRLAAAWIRPDADLKRRRYFESRSPQPGELYYTLGDYDVW